MDREAFKNLWAGKAGRALSDEESSLVDTMTLRELAKIFELVKMEKDWESEIKKMREARLKRENDRLEAEEKARNEAEAKAAVAKKAIEPKPEPKPEPAKEPEAPPPPPVGADEDDEEALAAEAAAAAAAEEEELARLAEEELAKEMEAPEEPPAPEDEEEEDFDEAELEKLVEMETQRLAQLEEKREAEKAEQAEAEEAALEEKRKELGGAEEGYDSDEEMMKELEAELNEADLDEADFDDDVNLESALDQELAEAEKAEEARQIAEAQELEDEEAELERLAAAELEAELEAQAEAEALAEAEAAAAVEAEAEAEAAAAAEAEAAAEDTTEARKEESIPEPPKEEAEPEVEEPPKEEPKVVKKSAIASAEATATASAAAAAPKPAKRKFRDENGKFILPPKASDLDVDPRTELEIVNIPEQYKAVLKEKFGENPLLHFIGECDKMNHLRKWDKRVLALTNYAMFIAHPHDGFLARSLEVADIEQIMIGEDILGFKVPREFDLIIKAPGRTQELVDIIQAVYKAKKKKEIPVVRAGEAKMAEECQLKKPNYWQPESKHVHSKEELFQRLEAMNREDDALAYLNLRKDPRTGLGLVEIPKEHKSHFQSGPFKTDPLLHHFSECKKVNSRLGGDKRFCLVTNACIYLTYLNGNLQRCAIIHKATELAVGKNSIALRIPEEFDVYLKFPDEQKTNDLKHCIQTIYKFKMQKDIPISEMTPEAAATAGKLKLNKPSGWKPRFAPVLQRKDLIDYLRKLGIRPDLDNSGPAAQAA